MSNSFIEWTLSGTTTLDQSGRNDGDEEVFFIP